MRKTPPGINWNLDWDHTMHTKKTTCGGANRDPIPLFE
jgi:hypothetical protein